MKKNIELELRAEIKNKDFKKILELLKNKGELISETHRLSVMFFGKNGKNVFDIRVRITNGESEVVIKRGIMHSHDRVETSQAISKNQFMGMVKIFNQLGFDSKVGERETFNFDFGDGVIASLVSAKKISYIELEKMSSKVDIDKNNEQLKIIANILGVKIIETSSEFNDLCDRLDKNVDWNFLGTNSCYKKLETVLKKY